MSAGTDPTKPTGNKKSNVYFAIGGVLLLLMGLFSAVDQSIVYILLGASSYFFFLGFNSRPKSAGGYGSGFTGAQSRTQRKPYQDSYARPALSPNVWDLLQKVRRTFGPGNTAQAGSRRALKIFLFIFISAFAIPIIASIFNGSGSATDASIYNQIAETQFEAGQYDSAYSNYKEALRNDPDYEDALLGYGKVFSAREQCDSAIIIYDKVLKLNAENRYATYYKAYCYYQQKRFSEGLDLVVPLVKKNDDYYEAILLMGDFYYAQNQNVDALTWYNKAYDEGGMRGLNLCYIMGYLYEEKKDPARAISLYQEALTYDSTLVDIYQRLGVLIPDSKGNYYRVKAAQLKPQ